MSFDIPKQLDELDAEVRRSAASAGLPERVAHGSDGDDLVWIWSDLQPPEQPNRAAEVQLRARFVPPQPGAALEEHDLVISLTNLAWMLDRRELSWTSTRFLVLLRPDEVSVDLSTFLSQAWDTTRKAASSLEATDKQRARARDVLARRAADSKRR